LRYPGSKCHPGRPEGPIRDPLACYRGLKISALWYQWVFFQNIKISQHFVGVPTAPKGEVAPLWKPASSLIAKKHTDSVQVKPIVQRGRPALAGRRRHPWRLYAFTNSARYQYFAIIKNQRKKPTWVKEIPDKHCVLSGMTEKLMPVWQCCISFVLIEMLIKPKYPRKRFALSGVKMSSRKARRAYPGPPCMLSWAKNFRTLIPMGVFSEHQNFSAFCRRPDKMLIFLVNYKSYFELASLLRRSRISTACFPGWRKN